MKIKLLIILMIAGLSGSAQVTAFNPYGVQKYATGDSLRLVGSASGQYLYLPTTKMLRSAIAGIPGPPVTSVNGQTGAVNITDITGNAGSSTKWGGRQADFSNFGTGNLNYLTGQDFATGKIIPWQSGKVREFLNLPVTGETLNTVVERGNIANDKIFIKVGTTIGTGTIQNGGNYLAFGDSVTEQGGYTNPLSNQLGLNLLNYGVGGTTSNDFVNHHYQIPDHTNEGLISVGYCINDAANSLPLSTFQSNLENAIDFIISKGYPKNRILLINGNYCDPNIVPNQSAYADRVIQVAKSKGILFYDAFNYTRLNGGLSLLGDGVHPTVEGGKIFARGLIPNLVGGGEFQGGLNVDKGLYAFGNNVFNTLSVNDVIKATGVSISSINPEYKLIGNGKVWSSYVNGSLGYYSISESGVSDQVNVFPGGSVQINNLKGSGDRVVFAGSDGILKTGDLSGYQTISNLSTDLTASSAKYPSVNAVNTGLNLKLNVNNPTATGTFTTPNLTVTNFNGGVLYSDASGNINNAVVLPVSLGGTGVTGSTGTGSSFVLSNAPTLINPIIGTQTVGDNSTKGASTAYADRAVANNVQNSLNPSSGTKAASVDAVNSGLSTSANWKGESLAVTSKAVGDFVYYNGTNWINKQITANAPLSWNNTTGNMSFNDSGYAKLDDLTQTVSVSGTSQSLSSNRIYIPHNASLTTFSLPTTASEGQLFQIVGEGAGGWRIAQNASQQIVGVNVATTSGTTGYVQSTNSNCTITIRCTVANSKFTITSSQGTLTIN